MFHHIYIEITNVCQFHCSFCPKTTRPSKFMDSIQFEHIVNQVKHHTKLIYLHVLGEPLIHPQLDELLSIAHEHGLQVNLTTNGFALAKAASILLRHHHIKKINISLHSMEDTGQQDKNVEQYLRDITDFASQATTQIPATIVYRLWNTNCEYDIMTTFLQEYYKPDFAIKHAVSPQNGLRLAYRIFLHQQNLFSWPIQTSDVLSNNTSNQEKSEITSDSLSQNLSVTTNGYCLGLKTHIAILSNGDVIPCCLDSEGKLRLGNIFEESLDTILAGERAQHIKQGFQQHKAVEPFCQTCTYRDRFDNQD